MVRTMPTANKNKPQIRLMKRIRKFLTGSDTPIGL